MRNGLLCDSRCVSDVGGGGGTRRNAAFVSMQSKQNQPTKVGAFNINVAKS